MIKHMAPKRPTHRPRHGFTLIELLMVIGIITVLISILLPAIAGVRKSAARTKAAAWLETIRGAVEQYKMTFGAYPGPLPDSATILGANSGVGNVSATVTSSENLLLGLIGGLRNINGAITYVPTDLGQGPCSLNPVLSNKRYPPMLDGWIQRVSAGQFNRTGTDPTLDSIIPEFIEESGAERPILYLRARVGAGGIISADGTPQQYDLRQITTYTSAAYNSKDNKKGLTQVTPSYPTNSPLVVPGPNVEAVPYFRDPSFLDSPRSKDRFILIGAGPDGFYGTIDDITSFGSVNQ